MLSVLFSVIGPVLLIALIGYAWARSGREFDTEKLTPIIITIGVPCLIIDTLQKVTLDLATLGIMSLAALLTHTVFLSVGWLALRVSGRRVSTFLPAMVFGNTGNMGLPLCLFAFGEAGLALAIAYFVVNSILLFTVGPALTAGTYSVRALFRTPLVWAVVVAVALMVLDITLPRWIGNAVHLLGGLTIPLMLLALGVSLARLKVSSVSTSTGLAVFRLALGAATGWAVALGLGLDGTALGVVVVQATMPVAVFNYLFAVRYNNNPAEVAGVVVLSTVLAFTALPLVLWSVMGSPAG